MEENKQVQQHSNWFVSFWHKVYEIIEKVGFLKTILVCFVCLFMIMCGWIAMHPTKIYEDFIAYEHNKRNESVKKRIETSPVVENLLHKLQVETDAHRCWVIEAHDQVRNTSGLDMYYAVMTYQTTSEGVFNSAEDFQDFSLSRFPMASTLVKEGWWSGSVQELEKIDKALAMKICVNSTKSLCICTLYGTNATLLGWLGVSFVTEDGFNEERVESIVRRYSYEIAKNIDYSRL